MAVMTLKLLEFGEEFYGNPTIGRCHADRTALDMLSSGCDIIASAKCRYHSDNTTVDMLFICCSRFASVECRCQDKQHSRRLFRTCFTSAIADLHLQNANAKEKFIEMERRLQLLSSSSISIGEELHCCRP
ncbi:hypothetical protein HAX54_027033 [Datura stramonium]|uniref:Uncharacterized protein n=1 Tax=Datura stramonium TaxID=4076 RepID=A0ABS8V431_DATST|nr:hypothetical protein [Datura stramonium]